MNQRDDSHSEDPVLTRRTIAKGAAAGGFAALFAAVGAGRVLADSDDSPDTSPGDDASPDTTDDEDDDSPDTSADDDESTDTSDDDDSGSGGAANGRRKGQGRGRRRGGRRNR